MKYLRILIFVLIAAALVYLPVSMLFSTAQVAPLQENSASESLQADILPLPEDLDGGLAPTIYTPESYIQPQYDPFNNKFRPDETFIERVEVVLDGVNTPPEATITARTARGIADLNSGTTNTEFRLSAHSSKDYETSSSQLKVRWDFETDGQFDTFFSRSKNTRHTFEEPGVYVVTLEVLDGGGLVSTATKEVMVVENTEPFAYFIVKQEAGTTNQIFDFDVSDSDDSQYKRYELSYRFDWNGDGQWDTPYKQKNIWRHRFDESGEYRVIMEAQDPEGASSFAEGFVRVFENEPPTASFTIDTKPVQVTKNEIRDKYLFDASNSFDPEGEKLQYRWDFNYTGGNDINFTTNWSTSPKYTGFYDFPGEKVIRLQVCDKDGAVDERFIALAAQ